MKIKSLFYLVVVSLLSSIPISGGAAPDSSDARKYAPSREIDIEHLTLDVTPDFKARTVAGTATLRFKPIAKPLAELKLDGIDLRVTNVTSTEKLLGWQATDKNVVINFEPPIPADREASVTITYNATPTRGLYFRTPEMGYEPGDTHLWTQGEPLEARHWFPSFDAPNEKFTSELICHVPEDITVLSNGKLVSEEKDAGSTLKAVRWLQDKPHANYLIALVAGYVKGIHDKHRDVPLGFYTPASQIAQATNSFKETKDMMEFFEKEIGVPYPWAKYYQVCVDDFTMGGMENTSLTILTDNTLHTDETENLRNSRGLVAHELAHQWFGDLVTCKDWSHLWLNEGFATYYEALYDGYKDGRDEFLYRMYGNAKGFLNTPNDTNAIVRRDFRNPEEQFGFHAYPKGAWILHMLRNQLGEDLFRRCVKTYLERYQYGNATTDDFNKIIEELSGRSFDQFFDQYVYHAHHPELDISYSWDERAKLAKLAIAQNQKLSEDVLLFNVPLSIRFKGKFGTIDKTIQVKERAEDFYFPLPEAPEIVRIDPDVALLAKITFSPPTSTLYAQLADKSDTMGRLLAVEQLSGKRDALEKLKNVLKDDPFYAVRLAASRSIRAIQAEEALPALIASVKQSDARVRRQVMSDLASFYRDSSYAEVLRAAREEKNPDIKALAIAALGAYQKPEVKELLLQNLNSTSYQNVLASAAINGIRAQDDASYIAPLLETLKHKVTNFTTAGFARGLDTLAWLARNEEKKDGVREFLVGFVNSPKRRVQLASIAGLGTLGDTKAIAVLEKFASAPKEGPERTAAEKSLTGLRDTKKPSAELGNLRSEVLGLQRENRDLRKDLDELKKKLDALSSKPAPAPEKDSKSKPPKAPKKF
jgi:aminopeptidase N